MTTEAQFELADLGAILLNEQIELLGSSFEKPVDEDWFRWKHLDGPWGPSHGVVAIDDQGPAAMLLVLPWQVRYSGGLRILGRSLDSGTLPRAQRRGLFRTMVAKWVNDERSAGQPFTFCTASEAAASSHAKGGATVLSFTHALASPFTSSIGVARFVSVPVAEAVTTYGIGTKNSGETISTHWEPNSLAWRFDPRSGLDYKAALLKHADASTGLVYRIESRRGIRILIRTLVWGDNRGVARLTASVARWHRAPLALDLARHLRQPRRVQGTSLVCAWSHSDTSTLRPTELQGWDLTLTDLEGVI
jgi:hypothetical protein